MITLSDQFRIWSVGSIEEGIKVLTGVPAGKKKDGNFSPEDVFAKVDQRLAEMPEELVKFGEK